MRIVLDDVMAVHDSWFLNAEGIFEEGVHLVSGPVGSGKSTLALLMAGILPTFKGKLAYDGIRNMMLSMQFPEFHITGFSVEEECESWRLDTSAVLQAAGLNISKEISPLSLSRGELKRFHLACILSHDYDLLLLDEPFSSLDCETKERLCESLSKRVGGITVIFTHEQEHLPRVDRIWEISDGELFDLGRVSEAITRWHYAPDLVKRLVDERRCPVNLTQVAFREAACRMPE